MKVIFLDVDGVLNSAECFKRWKGTDVIGVDPYMSILMHRVIEATGCSVVLSSSWRGYKDGEDEIQRMLGIEFYGKTPRDDKGFRGNEIATWLSEHPEVERYAIVDDNSDMLPEQLPNFFQTSWQVGMTQEIATAIQAHLS